MAVIEAFREAVLCVSPFRCVQQTLNLLPDALNIAGSSFPLKVYSKVAVIGFGKASLAMTAAAESCLGDHFLRGIVLAPEGSVSPYALKSTVCYGARNNLPDLASVTGTEKILSFIEECDHPDNILMFLISGGGSALFCSPDGVTLEEKLSTIQTLVSHGADIQQLNIVRQGLSRVKGGRTLQRIKSARVVSLIMSDIVGDPIHLIASGPTVSPVATDSPLDVVQTLRILLDSLPSSVSRQLMAKRAATVYQDHSREHHFLVGNNSLALSSVKKSLETSRYSVHLVTSSLSGDATVRGRQFGSLISANLEDLTEQLSKITRDYKFTPSSNKLALVFGGETTVKGIGGAGLGGRCQHMVLSCLLSLTLGNRPSHKFCFLAAGTDGQDGPTDAAGAMITENDLNLTDVQTIEGHLSNFDSYNFWNQFRNQACHLKTGKTGTNVMDIQICLLDYSDK